MTAHLFVQTLMEVTPVHVTLGTLQLMCMGNVEVSYVKMRILMKNNNNVIGVYSKDSVQTGHVLSV